jgi:hypothetical protein
MRFHWFDLDRKLPELQSYAVSFRNQAVTPLCAFPSSLATTTEMSMGFRRHNAAFGCPGGPSVHCDWT